MNESDGMMFKAAGFGIASPLLFFLFQRWFGAPTSAALAAVVTIPLFQWLPPRIHRGLSVPFSAVIAAAGAAVAGFGVWAVDRFL